MEHLLFDVKFVDADAVVVVVAEASEQKSNRTMMQLVIVKMGRQLHSSAVQILASLIAFPLLLTRLD